MKPTKISGWKELVHDLKRMPSFGFHGAKNSNLQSILISIPEEGGLLGHYFGANNEMKNESDEKFYQRLYAGMRVAKNYSQALLVDKGKMQIRDDLLVILGISNDEENSRLGHRATTSYGESLAIGHDMNSRFSFYPLILTKDHLAEIDKSANSIRERSKNDHCPYVATSYFIEKRIIEKLLLKMKKTTAEHIKLNKQ